MKKFIALSAVALTMVGCDAQKKDLTASEVMQNVKTYYTEPVIEALDKSLDMPEKIEVVMDYDLSFGTEAGIPGLSSADLQIDLIERVDTSSATIGYDLGVNLSAEMETPNLETGEMEAQKTSAEIAAEARINAQDAVFQIRKAKVSSPFLPAEIALTETIAQTWYGESVESIDNMISGLPEMEGVSIKDLIPTDIKAYNTQVINTTKTLLTETTLWEKAQLIETEDSFYVLDVEMKGTQAIEIAEKYIIAINETLPGSDASTAEITTMLADSKEQMAGVKIQGKLHVDPTDFAVIGFDGDILIATDAEPISAAKIFFENKDENIEFSIKINEETAFAFLKKDKEFSIESEGETIVKGEIGVLGWSMDFYSMGEKAAQLELQKNSAKLSFEDAEMPTIIIDEMSADDLLSYTDMEVKLKGRVVTISEEAETQIAQFHINAEATTNPSFDLSTPSEIKPVAEFMEAVNAIQMSMMNGATEAPVVETPETDESTEPETTQTEETETTSTLPPTETDETKN